MAKENNLPPIVLFLASAILLTGGWMMALFPVFILFGLAPLFALTDRATDTSTVWEKMEWVLFALIIHFLAARTFDLSFIVSSIVYAICFSLPFVGYVWVRQTLGPRAGKITILLFWLSIEYLLLKTRPAESIFLADSLQLHPDWTRWSQHAGYLGASGWILVVNLLVYQSFLSKNPFQWYWLLATLLFIIIPPCYSYFSDLVPISKEVMRNLYSDKSIIKDVMYLARGEFVVRTAAWVSTLILLFTFVKSQTSR